MGSLPYYLYMAESEGYLTTRESRINRIIKLLKECGDPNLYFDYICDKCGLPQSELTTTELMRIKRMVEHR